MKTFYTFLLVISMISMFGQQSDFSFPMKGDYIYYQFDDTTQNSKYCIKHYSNYSENSQQNTTAIEFQQSILKKTQNLNELKLDVWGGDLNVTSVNFNPPMSTTVTDDQKCIGECSGGSLIINLPVGNPILPEPLLFSLMTIGKFKIGGQLIQATVKIRFTGDNSYSLIFTKFSIKYSGTKGLSVVTEDVDLEKIYTTLQQNKKDDKMYAKSSKTLMEIDRIVKALAGIYQKELRKAYEVDEL